jgi:hypothetical protein
MIARTDNPNPLTRVEAYSDGVFAIAATLLIIEIEVPSVGLDDRAVHSVDRDVGPAQLGDLGLRTTRRLRVGNPRGTRAKDGSQGRMGQHAGRRMEAHRLG